MTLNLKKLFNNVEEYLCILLLAVMSIVVFIQVFFRFTFKIPLQWSEELSIFIMGWVAFLGASIGVKRGAHIGVEALVLVLPAKVKKYLVAATSLISAVFFLLLINLGMQIVLKQYLTGQVSPAMRIPMYYAYLSLPIGSTLIAIRFLQAVYQNFKLGGEH